VYFLSIFIAAAPSRCPESFFVPGKVDKARKPVTAVAARRVVHDFAVVVCLLPIHTRYGGYPVRQPQNAVLTAVSSTSFLGFSHIFCVDLMPSY
jgi:hypothetical protein